MLLAELGAYLATEGVGTVGTDIFYGTLPATPEACVALFEYGGIAPEHNLGTTALRYEMPRVQVLTRHGTYLTGIKKAQDVTNAFAAIANSTISEVYYLHVEPLQSPFLLDRDQNDRWIFACNYQVRKAVSSS